MSSWIIVVIFGLAWGSFLSVVKNRLDNLGTVLYTRSHCPKCKRQLGAVDLIPILSFILLRGRCRYCKKRISWEYPLFEILSLILAVFVYYKFGFSLASVVLFLSLSALLVCSFVDIQSQEVDLPLFIFGILTALFWALLRNGASPDAFKELFWAVAVAVVVPLGLYLISREKWMGLGDSFFALWVGLLSGFPQAALAIFLAFFLGAIFGIIALVIKGKRKTSRVAFGPFIGLGGIIALGWGQQIIDFYLSFIGL
ncbi:MAG: prepilin peptidase [Candidatus Berkelbacteria bacterium]|nr:prepilin peptidase [Candidatus Berkelbacteria bacterium]